MRSRSLILAVPLAFAVLAASAAEQTNCSMLIPGFVVQELPIKLSNLNNLRFSPRGELTALGYDGRIHILRDTDGDGLEDTAAIFWDQPTLSVPVGMVWSEAGLYVSSHGKVSLLRDLDGDGKADKEEVVASGWPPTDVASGGVDATAVTRDREGNLFFGLLTADYSNPYRVKEGQSHYDLKGQRGTIQKWSASTRQLETIATGIRVPYTLAFNRAGDLFVTDQEGETWCPGGNPLDELNHIIAGRNYGFPPRDEKYLPGLVSEPPVVAFGPQHQSACGLVFNEARPGWRAFGPSSWEGDALVAGESRGKIWRVRLIKTPAGYVGQHSLIARLNLLTMDLAISPAGHLYVCCHSGEPDWGTGPRGAGKIFRISYADTSIPQPAAIWASGLMEVQVAFDRALDPAVTNRFADMKIEFGEYVSAADRLEALKPPYKVVKEQEATPRGTLRVSLARLSPDHRTLTLITDPHPQSVRYALTLPGIRAEGASKPPATLDLAYDLNGFQANWSQPGTAAAAWAGWLPHPDWEVSTALTTNSAPHQQLRELVRRKGTLKLVARIVPPAPRLKLFANANAPFTLDLGVTSIKASPVSSKAWSAEASLNPAGQSELLAINLQTGSAEMPQFHLAYSTEADSTTRPFPLGAFLTPNAPAHVAPSAPSAGKTELSGGDYERGRSLFFGEKLKCGTCHRLRDRGTALGPELGNLVHRDPASVLRDIKEPNAAINPDYVAYNLQLRDGSQLTGFVRLQTADRLRLVGADGKEQVLDREQVSDLRPSSVSLMPSGLLDGLNDGQVRDLLTFLLYDQPVRSPTELEAVLGAVNVPNEQGDSAKGSTNHSRSLNIVLVASKQDHGPGQHDYPAWQKSWQTLLGRASQVTATNAWEWPDPAQFRAADVVVFYYWNHDWNPARYQQLDEYQARGGGIVIFHSATIADKEPEQLAARIGLASQPGPTKYLHTPLRLDFVAPTNHPITRGFTTLDLLDEPYWPMFGDRNRIEVLANAEVDGQAQPLVWTCVRGKGRVFSSIIGHYNATFDDPLFRILAWRGLAWAAGENTARFERLK